MVNYGNVCDNPYLNNRILNKGYVQTVTDTSASTTAFLLSASPPSWTKFTTNSPTLLDSNLSLIQPTDQRVINVSLHFHTSLSEPIFKILGQHNIKVTHPSATNVWELSISDVK